MAGTVFAQAPVTNSSPLLKKAEYLQRNLIDKHLVDGLYVSIVPAAPEGTKLPHTVDDPGNVIHAGVWTGRYLAGVAYQYAVTKDPAIRKHGGDLLIGLRRLQEVTGKPGLLARGYVKGHGPVEGFERGGGDSSHWHQGQGAFADYRFYSDVSVDNFNAVLYGYALYFDLAADAEQKKMIAYDVDRLMTHVLDNHYRIIDLSGKVTQYGHIGVDPDPSRDSYYAGGGDSELRRYITGSEWHPGLRASLMALPDLLIAYHVTGKQRYIDEYRKVIARFGGNAELAGDTRPYSLERIARVNHSSEGQAYEALVNLFRYEKDLTLLDKYEKWLTDLWDLNWMEGNSLYTFMTLEMLKARGRPVAGRATVVGDFLSTLPHTRESLDLSIDTLRRYPVDRVLHPVMNSIRPDIEMSPFPDRGNGKQAAKPVPMDLRPLDNEYAWKGNPYAVDGWLKPSVTSLQFACDDPMVAWFSDASGRAYMTRDGMKTWTEMSFGLEGAKVQRLVASPTRTFVVWAETDRGVMITRDGGMSWRAFVDKTVVIKPGDDEDKKPAEVKSEFAANDPHKWVHVGSVDIRIDESGKLLRRGGGPESPWMEGWRIPVANWMIATPKGIFAGGPGGAYMTSDGAGWKEVKLWRDEETGAADYLHAYWMGRYYGFYWE